MALGFPRDHNLVILFQFIEKIQIDVAFCVVFRLDHTVHLRQRVLPFDKPLYDGFLGDRVEIDHVGKLVFQRAADCSLNAVIWPDAEGLFSILFKMPDIIPWRDRIDDCLPLPAVQVRQRDRRVRRRIAALLVNPPARVKDLMRRVRVDGNCNIRNRVHIFIDKAGHALYITVCPGNSQRPLFHEILLHINSNEQDPLTVLSWRNELLIICPFQELVQRDGIFRFSDGVCIDDFSILCIHNKYLLFL